ncbi:LruC domain-containing protein [Emticicia sp. TH156]|uniref:LruC domain-containing protein n=1 Tax=Emticicia sp. TH156 TaxID=2067454 RepID=UPI000C77CFA0|nr:LruC domain-containing protein [Emticicia sp. TH156]PLK45261.1 hypothetical protein C0V77_08535 [Emticicia sp. TH156]
MYKRKNFRFLLLGLTGIMLGATSCSKLEFTPTDTTPAAAKLFPSGSVIPSDFKWSSVRTLDVRVVINDKYNGQYFYKVELFDNDPKLGTAANLLGAGQAKKGQDFVDKVTVPVGLQYVYLRETSPVGIASVSMVSIKDVNSVTVSKSGDTGSFRASALRGESANSMAGVAAAYSIADNAPVVVPNTAIAISGKSNITVESNKAYVVKASENFIGEINANNGTSGVKIYIQGTWKNRNFTLNLGGNNAIIVTSGGTLDLVNVIQNTGGAFANYGTAIFETLNTSNETLYTNYGTLNAKSATFANGSFTNYGTASIDNLTSTTGSTKIRNEGTLQVKDASLTNATLENVCHTTIDNLTTTNATINVAEKSLLGIKKLVAGGTKINLASSAILDVWVSANFTSNKNYMIGTGTESAVARMKKVDVNNQWEAITYSGNLEIACSDHTPNGQWSTYYIVSRPAALVAYEKSTVKIASTNCNAGGNNDSGSGTTPTDQTITEVNLGTYSYSFEDNWPETGDYDLNDFVVDMNVSKFQNSSNKTVKVALKAKLRSVGATKRMSGAIQLDGIASGNVKSVTYSRQDLVGNNLKLASNGVESGQTNAVVTIVDDAHKAFGVADTRLISTQNGNYSPLDLTVTIEFNTPVENFTYNALNVFVVLTSETSASGRSEVHLVGFKATDKISKSIYEGAKGKLLSLTDPYKSINNEPWGLALPVSFVSPPESKNIKDVYPKFQEWALSGGLKNTDWYLSR